MSFHQPGSGTIVETKKNKITPRTFAINFRLETIWLQKPIVSGTKGT